jgi:type II secretory pathway pseudopilin PulG
LENGGIMQRKRKIGFILEAIFVFVIMATLSSIAVPKIADMIGQEQSELRSEELGDIQMAVTEMLADSQTKTLQPVGPTRDMGLVRTTDTPPLALENYLGGSSQYLLKSDCSYSFASDGGITPDCP